MNDIALARSRDPRVDRALELKDQLLSFETTLDSAIAAGGNLIAGATLARTDLGVDPSVGSATLAKMTEATMLAAEAKSRIAEVHKELTLLSRTVLGAEATTTLVGPVDKPEDTPPIGGGPKNG